MALTPEDVLNKNFTATQFRRGYDEQEVDDFLDEVVAELRRLGGENTDLRRKLESGGARPAVAAGASAASAQAVEAAEKDAAQRIAKAKADAEKIEAEAAQRIAAANEQVQEATARANEAQGAASAAPTAAPAPAPAPAADAAGLIALAQKVHDEYVEQGRSEHDRLIGDATKQTKMPTI